MSNPFLIREPEEPAEDVAARTVTRPGLPPSSGLSPVPRPPGPVPASPDPVPFRSTPELRSFGDIPATRAAIFDRVQKAASNLSVVENGRYALALGDVHYADQDDPTPDRIKRTLLEGGTLARPLRGTWTLTDKQSGTQTHRTTVIAKIPYLLDNGTFLRNGTKYVLRNQSRLLPGIYARRKENGEHEVHVNADLRDGPIHHYGLDPETGQLNVLVAGSKMPLIGLARSLGASDEEMTAAWGGELFRVNEKKFRESQIAKLYEKLARGGKVAVTDREKMAAIRDSLQRIRLDPDVMEATLGTRFDHLDKHVLLAATKKLIGISRGEQESDDRDNMAYQEVYGPEDLFEERLTKDSGGYRRMLLNHLTRRYGGNIDKLPAGALSKQIDTVLLGSGLAGNPEEINRLEIYDKAYSLTKLGQGGVPSVQSVPDESRNVHPSQRGYIDPARTPESPRVGVDTYLATASRKGSDRQLYAPVLDRSGRETMLRPKDLLRGTVAIAAEYHGAQDDDYIPVMKNGREEMAPKKEVDYLIPHFEGAFSPLANLIPWKSAAQGNRVAMGSRMLTQAVSLKRGEAPLVQSAMPGGTGRSYYEEFGREVGAVFADQPGRVLEATDRHLLIEQEDGTKRRIPLDFYQPSNRKTYSHQTPSVTVGRRVAPGDLLARSNMTDDQGRVALGLNAKVVMIPWLGLNFEDGMAVSESFAKRMTSQHMYQSRLDWTPDHKRGKHSYLGIYPSVYRREQLDRMDEHGVIQPGTAVESGDPLILAVRGNRPGSPKGNRKLFSDASVTWDHQDPGVVTDVFHSDKGTAVLVKTESQLKDGDKIANRYGNKGLVRILPDDEMPVTEDGMVAEIAFSPPSTLSRGNPVQLAELALGKIALTTGRPYHVHDFEETDAIPDYVERELQKYGIEPDSPVIDRKTGKRIMNGDGTGIPNGSMWVMKLHHSSESKSAARGLGGYGSDETPARGGAEGAKRIAPMHLNALVAHGAYHTFLDAKYARGQANDDYWMQYMQGANPVLKKTPLVYEKFENSLRASGIHVAPSEGRLHLLALTDADVARLAGDRELKSGETLRWEKNKAPVSGGLFDPSVFGQDGSRWGRITPVVPILNPVMEEPARILLGLKQKELRAVMDGSMKYRQFGTGFPAIANALDTINVPLAVNGYRAKIQSGTMAQRDHAVRALGYLKACESTGIHPRDWMLSRLPVLPPKFRPVSEMKDSNVPLVDDANYLYKILIDTNNALRDLRTITPNTKHEEHGLYEAYKQVTGLAEPVHPKLVQRQVRGLLKHVFGVGSSKYSMVQRNLLGTPTDLVGRAVIVPNPDLDMDSVGLPEEKAWTVYRPHLVHRMTKRGIPWSQAARWIEGRHPLAREALLQEMSERPVLIDRAPVLHKWGILAVKPQLMTGDAIHLNPFIEKGLGADFDGDAMNFHVPSSPEAVREAYQLLLPSKSLIQSSDLKSVQPRPISEHTGGLYLASLPADRRAKTRTFISWADAERAYRHGELAIDDPIEILSSRPLPKRK
jgi:DNA-directed RNA polymerase beta subunit